jgi:hypothetical protein
MNLEIEGALKYRGKGVVTKNKVFGEDVIQVFFIEAGHEIDGHWEDDEQVLHIKCVDRLGNPIIKQVSFAQSHPATWYKSANRRTSPDVTKGETVHLWEFENTRVYFWTEDPRTDHYRRLEDILFLFSNISDIKEDNAPQDESNAYSIRISTKEKKIYLRTNDYDGEPFTHELQLDTGKGVLTYKDNTGIEIEASSPEDKVRFINASGSEVKAQGPDIDLTSVNVNLNCETITSTAKLIDFSKAKFMALKVHASHPHLLSL